MKTRLFLQMLAVGMSCILLTACPSGSDPEEELTPTPAPIPTPAPTPTPDPSAELTLTRENLAGNWLLEEDGYKQLYIFDVAGNYKEEDNDRKPGKEHGIYSIEGKSIVCTNETFHTFRFLVKSLTANVLVMKYDDDDDDYETYVRTDLTQLEEEDNIVPSAEFISATLSTATIKGNISGVSTNVEVGILYSSRPTLTESSKRVKTTALSNFEVTLSGLYENMTYYYCAYAIVDGVFYKGNTQEFKTKPFTYIKDGKTYGLVVVEGGPTGTFCITPTELDTKDIDANSDGEIIQAEQRYWFSELREATGIYFRLPTQSEWEFAATGGNKSKGYTYAGSNIIDDVAWYVENSGGSAHPSAQKQPNELGLYDMCGNLEEMVIGNDQIEKGYWWNRYYYYGGFWKSDPSDCTPTSYRGFSSGPHITYYLRTEATIRLVYSRKEE